MNKATAVLAEAEAELQAKKAASRRAKVLRSQLAVAERTTADAAARQQHLLHVAASLRDRAQRQDAHVCSHGSLTRPLLEDYRLLLPQKLPTLDPTGLVFRLQHQLGVDVLP